ncbi:MAG TPA: YeeE/YedE family protein [Aquimonas sp.]|nr:YeeE/YedE family protein [Aquimonas sp.]
MDQAYFNAMSGGLLIGFAVSLMLWFNGRIAGISGIFGDIFLTKQTDQLPWRALFIVGLMLGYIVVKAVRPDMGVVVPQGNTIEMGIAGLLVGFGTRLGCGCTSGHGICGVARLSMRSFVATALFIGTASIVVFVKRHVL